MKKITLLLSTLVFVSMLLVACAGSEKTSTTVPNTQPPAMTEAPTLEATQAPATTATSETTGVGTGTPGAGAGVPVTGEENPSRISNELNYIVVNQNGEQIGEVNDMVLDLGQSRVAYVIVGTGGFLDIGEKDVLVPWNQLQLQTAGATTGTTGITNNNANGNGNTNSNTNGNANTNGNTNTNTNSNANGNANSNANSNSSGTTTTALGQPAFVLLTDQAMFENAPDVDVNTMLPPLGMPAGDWDLQLHDYWQGGGAGAGAGAGTGTGTGTAVVPETVGTVMPGATAGAGNANGNANSNTNGNTNTNANSNANMNGAGAGTGVMAGQLQGVVLATDVLGSNISVGMNGAVLQSPGEVTVLGTGTPGATVGNANGNTNGNANGNTNANNNGASVGTGQMMNATVEDLIVNIDTGDIQYVVINSSIEGNERWIPVPLNLFSWDPASSTYLLNVDSMMLSGAPFFADGQFPDTSMSGWDTEFNSFWKGGGTGTGTGTLPTATP